MSTAASIFSEGRFGVDRIYVRDLLIYCIVGLKPEERSQRQPVVINLAIECDLRAAGRSDDLRDTINYKKLEERLVDLVEGSSFLLIERLAQAVADLCLEEPLARAVRVTIDKPDALRFARCPAVEIERARGADQAPG